MTRAGKASYAVTSRYATALIDLAEEAGITAKVEQDLAGLAAMIKESPELAAFIQSPSANVKRQEAAVLELAAKAKFQDITKNFLGVLVNNRRLYALAGVIEAVRAELANRRGEVSATVETAQDLSPQQLKSLQDAIAKGVGHDVNLKARVEPGILGGMIVTVGSKMIDASVRRKLERLRGAMTRQANQNVNKKVKEVG